MHLQLGIFFFSSLVLIIIIVTFLHIILFFIFFFFFIYYYSPGEARKAFGLYLGCILRKISQPSADSVCCDLIMKFLQQSSSNLRTPFLFTVSNSTLIFIHHNNIVYNIILLFQLPSNKLSDKDRAAITAKQLSDFLHLYNRETDLYADTVDRPRTVPNRLFQKFLSCAR